MSWNSEAEQQVDSQVLEVNVEYPVNSAGDGNPGKKTSLTKEEGCFLHLCPFLSFKFAVQYQSNSNECHGFCWTLSLAL